MAKKKLSPYEQAQRQFVQSRIAQSGQEATPELRARYRERFGKLAQEKEGRTKIAQRVLPNASAEERKAFKRTLANELPARNMTGTTSPTAPVTPKTPKTNITRDAGPRSQLQTNLPKTSTSSTGGGQGDRGKYTVGQVLGPVGGYVKKTGSEFIAPLQGKAVTYEPSPVFKFAEEKNIPVVGRIAPGARELSKGTWAGTAGAAKQIGLAGVDYYFLKGGLKAVGYGLKKVGSLSRIQAAGTGIKNLFGRTTTGQVARDLTAAAKRGGTALRGSKASSVKTEPVKPIEPVKVDKPTTPKPASTKSASTKAGTKVKETKVEPAKAQSKPIEPVKVDKPKGGGKPKGGTTTRGSKASSQKKSNLEYPTPLSELAREQLADPWSRVSQQLGAIAKFSKENPTAPLPRSLTATRTTPKGPVKNDPFGPLPSYLDKTFVKQYENALELVKSRGAGWQQAKVFVRTKANIDKYGKLKGFK